MARYLIAGAAGYVGSRLAEQLLARGESVRGLVRDPDDEAVERLAGMGMAVWQGDVTHPSQRVLDRVGHPHLTTLDEGALVGLPSLAQVTGAVQGDPQV